MCITHVHVCVLTIVCTVLCVHLYNNYLIIADCLARQIAVCNLASIALNRYVNVPDHTYDFKKLMEVTRVVTRNLNKIIDVNYYPVPEVN